MTMSSRNRLAPLSELFLLLPDHRRILLGESRQIGVENEGRELQRAAMLLSAAALINVLVVLFGQVYAVLQSSQTDQSPVNVYIGLFPAVLMLVFLFFVTQRFKCKAKLEREGILLPGEVIEAALDTAITWQGTQNVVRLRYAFVAPRNRRIVKEETQIRNDLDFHQLPEPKTPLAIIYASDRCFRVL
jgi:hypothetical protein